MQSCAQIAAPTGGTPDTSPPFLDSIGTIPLNYSTHFEGDKLVLAFNEYFVLKNPKQTVFFSPNIENEPEFVIKGKTLTIHLNNDLKPNTTYTVNFGDAISDYTVGNALPDFKFVFSTGSFIDSMNTSGKVIDALSGKPQPNVLVMLYENTQDSVVSKERPVYYAITNKEGKYSLSNIKKGAYKLFALKDENRNFLYDLPNEQIGTIDSIISLDEDTVTSYHILSLFTQDYIKQSVTSKKFEYPGKLTLTFARSVEHWNVLHTDSVPLSYTKSEMNTERDSLVLWGVSLGKEKALLTITTDTSTEIINVYQPTPKSLKEEFTFKNSGRSIDKKAPLSIEFNRPISSVNQNLISIIKDTTLVAIDSVSFVLKSLNLYFSKKEDQTYKYQLLPNSVEDIFEFSLTDTVAGVISVKKDSYFGSFTLKAFPKNDSVSYLLYLLNEEGKQVKSQKFMGESSVSFLRLKPGKYALKAIEDVNKNGKWDTGDYYLKKKPEPVFFFPTQIEIRSNWDLTENWKL